MASLIENTANTLTKTLDTVDNITVPSIPTPLLYLAGENHNGLDYERLANKIMGEMGKLEPKIPIQSNLPNGEKSLMEQVITVACKCMVEEFMNNAKIEIALASGVSVTSWGTNAGGPIITNGYTLNFVKGNGTIS